MEDLLFFSVSAHLVRSLWLGAGVEKKRARFKLRNAADQLRIVVATVNSLTEDFRFLRGAVGLSFCFPFCCCLGSLEQSFHPPFKVLWFFRALNIFRLLHKFSLRRID